MEHFAHQTRENLAGRVPYCNPELNNTETPSCIGKDFAFGFSVSGYEGELMEYSP
jgi:hypothetical protein